MYKLESLDEKMVIGIREWAIEEAVRMDWRTGGNNTDEIIVTASLLEKYVKDGWVPELKKK